MPWTSPVDRSTGDLITDTIWNAIMDNQRWLHDPAGKSTSFTLDEDEARVFIIDTSGGVVTVTLPDPTTVTVAGIVIKRNGASAVNITGTIDGQVNPTLGTDRHWVQISSNGDEWHQTGGNALIT